MLGAHIQVLTAQTPQVPLKEPSCLLLPESDLGALGSPQGTFPRPLPYPAVLATDIFHHQVALVVPAGLHPTGLPAYSQSGA